jgi:hypothetical protein
MTLFQFKTVEIFHICKVGCKMSFEYINKLSKVHSCHQTLTEADKLLILEKYSPIFGDTNEWIDWVLSSCKRGLCPYR